MFEYITGLLDICVVPGAYVPCDTFFSATLLAECIGGLAGHENLRLCLFFVSQWLVLHVLSEKRAPLRHQLCFL